MRDKLRHLPGGRKGDACEHRLSQKSLRIKPLNGLRWKVEVVTKTERKTPLNPNLYIFVGFFFHEFLM